MSVGRLLKRVDKQPEAKQLNGLQLWLSRLIISEPYFENVERATFALVKIYRKVLIFIPRNLNAG